MSSSDAGAALNQLIHEMSGSLTSHLIPALEEMKRKFDDEEQRVVDWGNDVLHAVGETEQAWKAFAASTLQDLQSIDANVEASIEGIQPDTSTYDGALHHAEEALGVVAAAYHDQIGLASEVFGELLQHHGKLEEDIGHHLSEFTGTVTGALHTLEEHGGQIADAYQHVTHAVASGVEDVTHHLGSTASAVTEHVSGILQQHASGIAELVSNSGQHLVQGVTQALGETAGAGVSALGEFLQKGEELGQAFDGGLGDVLGVVEHVADVVDSIKPVIELAETVL
jgi:methyl-accepting chemotaxis protein